jgi:hypothetical protein
VSLQAARHGSSNLDKIIVFVYSFKEFSRPAKAGVGDWEDGGMVVCGDRK